MYYNHPMDEERIDPEKQVDARKYARLRRRLMLVELTLGAIYTLAWLVCGWSNALLGKIQLVSKGPWLEVAALGLTFAGVYLVINLPLSFFSSYVLPHRFQLSNQTLKGWTIDLVKGLSLGALFGILLLEAIYEVLRAAPEYWWLIAGFLLLAVNVVLATLAPVLLMPLFFKLTPLAEKYWELSDRLVELAEGAGTLVRGVFQIDLSRRTKAANAALVGLGNTRRIILGDTLLEEFTSDEIETVFAHELGHQVHKDIPLGMMFDSLLTLAGLFLANLVLNWGVEYFGFQGVWDPAALPLLILAMGVFGLLTMPLSNTLSRQRERKADLYALEATGKGEAYASALVRLANQNLAEAEPEAWVELLLYSHPALGKRIEMARSFNRKQAA